MSRRFLAPLLASFAAACALAAAVPATAEVFSGAERDQPLPRFEDAVCPGVSGFQQEFAEMIVYRIRENAQALGLRLADAGDCEPNVVVAALPDPQAFVRRLQKKKPYIFEELDRDQQRVLFDEPGPVRSINRVGTRTRDGLMVWRSDNLEHPPQTTMQMAHSKIYVATRRDIFSSMVLFDADAASGLSVVQLADYATMRAFAGDSADALVEPGGSILTLFDGTGERPTELSRGDRTFLRTLYSTLPNNPAAITLAMAEKRIAAEAPE